MPRSCQYGTFIGNCEREREVLRLSEKTYSLWGYLIANNDEFTNPLYESSTQGDVLRPQIAPQSIRFWSGLYCRFEDGKQLSIRVSIFSCTDSIFHFHLLSP